jgi:hypothetical protein
VAHRVISLQSSVSVAFGGKRTSSSAVPKVVYHRLLILQAGERRLNFRSLCSLGTGDAVNRDDSLYAPQILDITTCTRLRHCWCIQCHWCFRELGVAHRAAE